MYCKDCKYWERHSESDAYLGEHMGKCHSIKFIDTSQGGCGEHQDDTVEINDFESYGIEFKTGEKFGCIHFERGE